MKSVFFLVFVFFSVYAKAQQQLPYEGEKVIYRDSMNGSKNFNKRVKLALYEYGQNFPALGYHYNVGQVPYFIIYDDSLELLARVVFLTGNLNPTAWKF